jgi:hypothetical protein
MMMGFSNEINSEHNYNSPNLPATTAGQITRSQEFPPLFPILLEITLRTFTV